MNVVIASNFRRDERLGTSRTPLRLAVELERLGVHVTTLFAEDLPRSPPGRADQLSAPFRMAASLSRAARSADVVDIAGFDGWAFAMVARRRRLRTAVVSRSNGLWFLASRFDPGVQRSNGRRWLSRFYQRQVLCRWERASITRSDVALFLSSGDAERVVELGWKRREEVAFVNPATDDFFASPVPIEARRGVAFVGTFFPRKGSDVVVAAMSRLMAVRPELRLSVFGPGIPPGDVLSQFDPGVRGRVDVVPTASPEELAERLAAHAIFLFPTRYEGFGIVVLEAMRAGLAVVTTPTGAGLDVVRHEENGIVVPAGEIEATVAAVARLLDDGSLRARLATAAVEDAARRTWKESARQMVDVYERAIDIAAARAQSGSRPVLG